MFDAANWRLEIGNRTRLGGAALLMVCCLIFPAAAEEKKWGDFIEPDFPFFCHTLDGRKWSKEADLVPRGVILKLRSAFVDDGVYACFDPDLLRFSFIWRGKEGEPPIDLTAMAPGSYHDAARKAPGGQDKLPAPIGTLLLSNGRHPGWYIGRLPEKLTDPRPETRDSHEVGRGPIDPSLMRWNGLRTHTPRALYGGYVRLEYEVGGVKIADGLVSVGKGGFVRSIDLGPTSQDLYVAVGKLVEGWEIKNVNSLQLETRDGIAFAKIPQSATHQSYQIGLQIKGFQPLRINQLNTFPGSDLLLRRFPPWWDQGAVATQIEMGTTKTGSYAVDSILPPTQNPWKRNVRLSGFDFFPDGRAAFCTFDGDVWITSPITADSKEVQWKRYASGLNEPMALQIADNQIYVFGRTCIWRLHDDDGNGEADFYENFCNLAGQTAETREFANDMVKIPGGGFFIAKPGQLHNSRGLHNGTICKIAADGRALEVVARGFRQPFIGYDAKRGILTASDQQGNWVPSTPIHVVEKAEHYGYLPPMEKEHPQPVREPLVWIPHFVNQSGASQVTNHDARFGQLAGALLHIGFNRPELFRIFADGKNGAAAGFLSGFGTGTMKAAVNPVDGQLYVVGFRIWGTIASDVTGFYRVRHTGEGTLETPMEVRSSREGVLLRFDFPVDEEIAKNLANYEIDRWNYRRTSAYGSGHYKLDGEPGQETLPVSSAYVSQDKRAIFLGIADMQPCHSLRVTYRLPIASELPQIRSVYLTLHELNALNLDEAGFGPVEVDLTPPAPIAGQKRVASHEEGERLYVAAGCAACHTIDGTQAEKPGPTWLGLYGSKREFADGGYVKKADDVYLRESILDPNRRVSKGYVSDDVKMPAYLGILRDYQVDSLILYIKSLKK